LFAAGALASQEISFGYECGPECRPCQYCPIRLCSDVERGHRELGFRVGPLHFWRKAKLFIPASLLGFLSKSVNALGMGHRPLSRHIVELQMPTSNTSKGGWAMRLKFDSFDGRGRIYRPIIDEDTGVEVGYIRSHGVGMYCSGGMEVSLYDEKYNLSANRYDQCWGFVKGVEAVLKHMNSVTDQSDSKSKAA
jgi:hypothetical protein